MPLHICPYFSNTMSSRRYSLRRVGTIPFAETDYVDRPVVYIYHQRRALLNLPQMYSFLGQRQQFLQCYNTPCTTKYI